MSNFAFTPTTPDMPVLQAPFYEDARTNVAPYYASTRNIPQARAIVEKNISLLGGAVLRFQEGTFTVDTHERQGYQVVFTYNQATGMIPVMGLPMRYPSPEKAKKVKVQALLILGDWLKNAVTTKIFSPGTDPLIPYLLVDGQHTLLEYLQVFHQLPATVTTLALPTVTGDVLPPKSVEGA